MSKYICGIWLFIVGFGCNTSSDMVEVLNGSNTYSFYSRMSTDGLVAVGIRDMRTRNLIAEFVTDASYYQKFSLRWISSTMILLKSSDVGYRVITVGAECRMYFAIVNDECDGILEILLTTEEGEAISRVKVRKDELAQGR